MAALGYAVGVGTGRARPPSRSESADESAVTRHLRNPSVGTAAAAGVATHLPGLFYLVALNSIVTQGDSFAVGVAEVLLFNAIWFSAAIASVLIFLVRPGSGAQGTGPHERLGAAERAGDHDRGVHGGGPLPDPQRSPRPGRLTLREGPHPAGTHAPTICANAAGGG